MQFKNNKIFFSPSDLIIFMESQFASHMERSRLEDPNYSSLMDPEDAMLKNLQKRGYEHEDAFLLSLIGSSKKVNPKKCGTEPNRLWLMGLRLLLRHISN